MPVKIYASPSRKGYYEVEIAGLVQEINALDKEAIAGGTDIIMIVRRETALTFNTALFFDIQDASGNPAGANRAEVLSYLNSFLGGVEGSGGDGGNSGTNVPLISLTYTQLKALADSATLVEGQSYKITDYQTVYTQPITNVLKTDAPIEPIIVTAVGVNKLHAIAKSITYPEDILHYDIGSSVQVGTGTQEVIEGATKGGITRRIDTINNIDIGFDWRNVKFARYAISQPQYNSATSYSIRNVVKNPANNDLYVSLVNSNLGNPITDGTKWLLLTTISNGEFFGTQSGTQSEGLPLLITYGTNYQEFLALNISDSSDVFIGNFLKSRILNCNIVFKSSMTSVVINVAADITADCLISAVYVNQMRSVFLSGNSVSEISGGFIISTHISAPDFHKVSFGAIINSLIANTITTGATTPEEYSRVELGQSMSGIIFSGSPLTNRDVLVRSATGILKKINVNDANNITASNA